MSKATSRRTNATAKTKIQPNPRSTKQKPNPRFDRIDPLKLPLYSALIILNDLGWSHASSHEWMRSVAAVKRTIDMLTVYDRGFAWRVQEWQPLSSIVEREAFTILDEFIEKRGPAVIPAHTLLALVFCILEGCGCFKRIQPIQPNYQFVIPLVVDPDKVREAVYRLLDTENPSRETVHPEKILTCVQFFDLPPELSVLEKSPKSFIYRSAG